MNQQAKYPLMDAPCEYSYKRNFIRSGKEIVSLIYINLYNTLIKNSTLKGGIIMSEKNITEDTKKELVITMYFYMVFFLCVIVFFTQFYMAGSTVLKLCFPKIFDIKQDHTLFSHLILQGWRITVSEIAFFIHVFFYIRYKKSR